MTAVLAVVGHSGAGKTSLLERLLPTLAARGVLVLRFNFLYTERTQTLNWPTWAVNLVIPLFAITMTLHGLANIVEDLGWCERRTHPEFKSAEGVN